MRQAYIVVTDLHLSGHHKANRHNYDKELFVVFHKIVELVNNYKQQQYEVFIVFLGDIFDKSYKAPEKYGIDSSFFVKLKNMTQGLFVCVGNHELNFYLNNPFWTLVSEIKSVQVSGLRNVNTQPLGYEDVFFVVDRINIGECVFHFNHYGCEDSPPVPNKTNIAFCHKPIYNTTMIDDAAMKGVPVDYARSLRTIPIETLCKYDYAFLGHMHWLYSTWKIDNTVVYGLSALGRPNKAEISNQFLARNIPVILLDSGRLLRIEDNLLNLPTREESIVMEIDNEQKIKYELSKRQKDAKAYISTTDDPIHNIRTFLVSKPRVLSLFDSLVDKSFSDRDLVDRMFDIERKARF